VTAERPQAPRGTYDVLPEQAPARAALEDAAARILGGAGYERIETPTFEATELFARGVGEATDIVQKEMYTLTDQGGRSITLRPEGTAPVCRAYMEHGMHKLPQPVRLWYLSSFFRQEKPQAGRFRQFWQVGAEAIGSDDPAVDAELIALLHALLSEIGAAGIEVRINSLGQPAQRATYREELIAYLRANEDRLAHEVRARIDLNPLRAFDSADPSTQDVMRSAPRLLDVLAADDRDHFDAVKSCLDAAGIAYVVDTALVRGIDYYTRTLFEFTSDQLGAQSAVGGGGRYDGLIEMLGGNPTPGCGWAAGVERMLLAAEQRPAPAQVCDLYVVWDPERRGDAFALVSEARRAGLAARMDLGGRSRKGQLRQADRLRPNWVATLDPGATVLRDRDAGSDQALEPTAIVHTVLRNRGL
jgi:histidyl-tRNA synthetase